MNRLRTVVLAGVLFLLPASLFGQAVAGDPLLKGQADIENAEVAAGAAIASSKLATDVVVDADIGAGLEASGGTVNTVSDENDFINAAAALSCGAGTRGQMAIVTSGTVLNYCDDTATPAQRYVALGASDGDAVAGDSATSFFDAGQIEAARGGTGIDTSGSTGVTRVNSGTWTADAGISHLASSTSADLAGTLSDETGTTLAVFNVGPNLQGVIDRTGTAVNDDDCTGQQGSWWWDSTDNEFEFCNLNSGAPDDFNAASNPFSLSSPEVLTISTNAVTFTGAANTYTAHTLGGEGDADDQLDTCNCTAGSMHIVWAENSTETITIACSPSAANFILDNADDRVLMHCTATNSMRIVARENGGT